MRQRPDHYTIRAGRNLPDKEFRYLRTVIVTAAVLYTSSFKFAQPCVFGKQLPGPFLCASYSYEDPLSRSYGVSLPNSLTVSLPSALVYSTRPRVSVYGTGRVALKFSGFSWQHDYLRCHPAPEGRAYSRASDQGVDFPAPLNSFALKPPIPSGGGSVTPASPRHAQCE